jgi:threonine dehydrogenase-like Zn-dependent dehydrogenase
MITAEKLVTHRFSIDETEKAYKTVARAQDSMKVIITF